MTEDGLGMNQHDHQEICDQVGRGTGTTHTTQGRPPTHSLWQSSEPVPLQVNVVFHCAATVRFDEQLRDAIQMNLLGTARIVALCHSVKKLMVREK